MAGYEREMRAFLDYVLDAYGKHGIAEFAPDKLADLLRIRYGGTNDAKRARGSVSEIRDAWRAVEVQLFQPRDPGS